MEEVPYHHLMKVEKEEMKKVRQFFDIDDPDRINEALDTITEWCQKQDHILEKNINRVVLERMLILSKGSVEVAKKKIDSFCTLRAMMPEFSINRSTSEFEVLLTKVRLVVLPKLAPDLSRVIIIQLTTEEIEELSLLTYFRCVILLFGELRLMYDYALGDQFIFDISKANISLISKISPILIQKVTALWTEAYGTKIMGLHFLNAPWFIDRILAIVKPVIKEKVAKRIHVHATFDDMYKLIPKDILPSDFGGKESSMEELGKAWRKELYTETMAEVLKTMETMLTDESKRSRVKFNEEYMGMPGSFRTLTVD